MKNYQRLYLASHYGQTIKEAQDLQVKLHKQLIELQFAVQRQDELLAELKEVIGPVKRWFEFWKS